MVKIHAVISGSLAARHGIRPGDMLISVNEHDINDVLDYRFFICEENLTLLLGRGQRLFSLELKKPEYDDIGLEFGSFIMDAKRGCKNKCIFCFIDQLPPCSSLRETLRFKDDDERLSFFHGNYITLTNLEPEHIERIIKMRISPVNISVHTMNKDLRAKMMGNSTAGEALDYIPMLAEGGIKMNFQLVLCRGINDGAELESSLAELAGYHPAAESIAVVPAGLTRYREGLYPLVPHDQQSAAKVIEIISRRRTECMEKHGSGLIYAADEFYLKAGIPIPSEEYYEHYPQLANGVGLLSELNSEFDTLCKEHEKSNSELQSPNAEFICLATGSAAYSYISAIAEKAMALRGDIHCEVIEVKNDFFGHEVTVAGLVTGADLIAAVKERVLKARAVLYIPSVMLRHEGDLFLDNIHIDEVREALGIRVNVVPPTAEALFDIMIGGNL